MKKRSMTAVLLLAIVGCSTSAYDSELEYIRSQMYIGMGSPVGKVDAPIGSCYSNMRNRLTKGSIWRNDAGGWVKVPWKIRTKPSDGYC